MIKSAFKDRTVGFYIGFCAAAIALVADILFIAIDFSDRTFSLAAFVLILIGALSVVLAVLTDLPFAPVLPAGCFIAGFALTLNAALPSLSDVWNGVSFIGGNAVLGMVFSAVFLLCAVASVTACFMRWRNSGQTYTALNQEA